MPKFSKVALPQSMKGEIKVVNTVMLLLEATTPQDSTPLEDMKSYWAIGLGPLGLWPLAVAPQLAGSPLTGTAHSS